MPTPQYRTVAEIIQRTAPDVLLINEFDYVPDTMGCFGRTATDAIGK